MVAPAAFVAAVLLFAPVSPVRGTDQSWTGTSSPFWTDAGNWASAVAPVPGDNLLFTLGNFSNRSNFNDFPGGTTFGSITIGEGNMVQYTLAGAPITLTNGISEYGTSLSYTPAIDCDISFPSSSSQVFSVGRSLALNGNLAMGDSSYLFTAGSGTIIFNGAVTGGGGLIFKTNSGTLVLSSGAVAAVSAIEVEEGLFRLNGAATNASGNCYVSCFSKYGPATVQGTGVVDQLNLGVGQPYPSGTLIPGDFGPGVMQCNAANLINGSMVEQINSPVPGTGYSQLIVSSNYCLWDESLACAHYPAHLVLALGYAPFVGDSFQIIKGTGVGAFDSLVYYGIAETNGYAFGVSYTNGVTLTTLRTPTSPFVLWSGKGCYFYPTAWSCSNNWVAGVAPGSGSRLQFSPFQWYDIKTVTCNGNTSVSQTNDLSPGTSLASLLYTGAGYVLYGNPITITEGITNHITQGTNSCFLGLVAAGPFVLDGDAGGTFLVAGSINGSGTVQKEGGGRLHYTGTTMNAFVGSVVVDNGEFRADGSFTDGSFAVNSGLLTGTGTVSSVTMTGGTLLPGASPGILHIQGNLTMSTGAVFQVELNGPVPGTGYDQLEVNGTVNLNGATLNVQPGFAISPGTAFLVLVNDTSNPLVGAFAGLPEGASFQAGGQYFSISYQAGPHTNDVLLTRLNPPGNFSGIALLSANTVQLQGTGGSNVAYPVQANTNLATTNWLNIGTATGGSSGVLLFDVSNILSFPQRFFRVQTP
jgi:hypothetical protein